MGELNPPSQYQLAFLLDSFDKWLTFPAFSTKSLLAIKVMINSQWSFRQ